MTPADQPLQVLFVCTANVSRSAYAEYRARAALGDAPVEVSSAGIPGYPGLGIDPNMADLLTERGVRPGLHLSRSVYDDLMDWADLVLTFEYAQHLRLLDAWPRHAGKVFGLRQFAEAIARVSEPDAGPALIEQAQQAAPPDSMSYDIDDTYRRGARAARFAADRIDSLFDAVLPALAGRPLERLVSDAAGRGSQAAAANSTRGAARRAQPGGVLWRRSTPRRAIE